MTPPWGKPRPLTDAEMLGELDAYGHLTWTMGDQDWLACFDAKRFGDKIAYHAVVNCESGGFIDTIEKGVIPVADAESLFGLPESYVDAGIEGHLEAAQKNRNRSANQRIPLGRFSWKDCDRRWKRHIKQLMKGDKSE